MFYIKKRRASQLTHGVCTRDCRGCEAVRKANEAIAKPRKARPPLVAEVPLFLFLGYAVETYYIVWGIDVDYSCSGSSSPLL